MILIFIIFLFLVSSILFYKCGYPLIEGTIKRIYLSKQNNHEKNITDEKNIKEEIDLKYKNKIKIL